MNNVLSRRLSAEELAVSCRVTAHNMRVLRKAGEGNMQLSGLCPFKDCLQFRQMKYELCSLFNFWFFSAGIRAMS